MQKNNRIKPAILSLLTIAAYLPTINWMLIRWNARDTYYSHGFLIPLISIFLVWQKRDSLKKIKIKPANIGWAFFGVGIIIHLVSAVWRVSFTSAFSSLLVIIGLVLLFLGKEYLRQLMFPILFLAFMMPLPEVAIVNLSFRLKIFAAQAATFIVNKLGVPCVRMGSLMKTMHAELMVEDPCSGIRSLIALIALGGLMAHLSNLPKVKKGVLFACSVPIAVSANIVRIVVITLASEMYGVGFGTGKFHDFMGVFVFVFAFLGLLLIGKILE